MCFFAVLTVLFCFQVYSDWCHEFQKYKAALKTWEKRRSQCSNSNALPPFPGLPAAESTSANQAKSSFDSNPLL